MKWNGLYYIVANTVIVGRISWKNLYWSAYGYTALKEILIGQCGKESTARESVENWVRSYYI